MSMGFRRDRLRIASLPFKVCSLERGDGVAGYVLLNVMHPSVLADAVTQHHGSYVHVKSTAERLRVQYHVGDSTA